MADLTTHYTDALEKIRTAEVLDVSDSQAIAYLKGIAQKTVPETTCTDELALDSFVPSLDNTKISCSVTD